ncbi:hypothetical protein [Caenispirillum bisanense]|uniref:hypothetical protein n=1 Tax=Caenispirillum bisanense TaxID=414052 RepID=UPI0031DDA5E2
MAAGAPVSSLAIAARLARALTLARGEAGCLWETWADPAAIAFLRHLSGLPDADDDPEAAAFLWRAEADLLVLDRPLLGITVRGIDPIALAEGLEDLGTLASTALPQAAQQAERSGAELAAVLPQVLRQAVAAAVRQAAPGVSYAVADDGAEAVLRPLDAGRLRQAQATVEVQDHRNVIPIRPPPA